MMTKSLIVAVCLTASAHAAKIFYSPGCNTNVNDVSNLAPGSTPIHHSAGQLRPPSTVPRTVSFSGSNPVDVNFPSGAYALGEIELPDGFFLTLSEGSEIDLVEAASADPSYISAGQVPKESCDITCHTNFRDGTPAQASGDLSVLPVATSPMHVNDDLVFPSGYNYALQAHGQLVAASSLSWKGTSVPAGPWNASCLEVSPCLSDTIPLRSMIGSGAGVAYQTLYGSSASGTVSSCPAAPVPIATDATSFTLPPATLLQMDMRRVGVQTSAPQRLAQIRSSELAGMCRLNSGVDCPTTLSQPESLIIDVTGFRPRADLALMTLAGQRTALNAHISGYVSTNIGEISNFRITGAVFNDLTARRLRLAVAFNVAPGQSAAMYAATLTRVVNELVGSYVTQSVAPACVSLADDVDQACVRSAMEDAFDTTYDGVRSMIQVREAMRAAYMSARACTVTDLGSATCTPLFTAPIGVAETTFLNRLVDTIISARQTPAPSAGPGQTAAPAHAPTTMGPTTIAPTTAAPATYAPTTHAPITYAPTTAANAGQPTSFAPTTPAPTTRAPATYGPTTLAPVTYAPTTFAPTVSLAADSKDAAEEAVGIPLLYAVIIACAIVVILAVAVLMTGKKKVDEDDAEAGVTAFENPMYDSGQAIQNPIAGTTEESTAVDDEQLYDAPVYAAQQEPAADDEDDDSGEEYDAPAQPAGDGGYLDVNEDDTQNGMYDVPTNDDAGDANDSDDGDDDEDSDGNDEAEAAPAPAPAPEAGEEAKKNEEFDDDFDDDDDDDE
eukprot:m.166064 g.166064  ORF g.166064 m.166064 type:complete len:783 (+) comp12643_c0_seq1:103-2451(+)